MEKPDLEKVKIEIESGIKEIGRNIICKIESEELKCTKDEHIVIDGKKKTMDSKEFLVIRYYKKHEKGNLSTKILNEIKIPIENNYNLHKRLTAITK